jgi:hypothetical protein
VFIETSRASWLIKREPEASHEGFDFFQAECKASP